jgi:hypothetical protein
VNHQVPPPESVELNSSTRPSGSARRTRAVGRQTGVLLIAVTVVMARMRDN